MNTYSAVFVIKPCGRIYHNGLAERLDVFVKHLINYLLNSETSEIINFLNKECSHYKLADYCPDHLNNNNHCSYSERTKTEEEDPFYNNNEQEVLKSGN